MPLGEKSLSIILVKEHSNKMISKHETLYPSIRTFSIVNKPQINAFCYESGVGPRCSLKAIERYLRQSLYCFFSLSVSKWGGRSSGTREMPRVKMLVDLAENQGLIPSTLIKWLTTA